jgi:hypothetical protein
MLIDIIDKDKQVCCIDCDHIIKNSWSIDESDPFKRMPYKCLKFYKTLSSIAAHDKQSIIENGCFTPSKEYVEKDCELF